MCPEPLRRTGYRLLDQMILERACGPYTILDSNSMGRAISWFMERLRLLNHTETEPASIYDQIEMTNSFLVGTFEERHTTPKKLRLQEELSKERALNRFAITSQRTSQTKTLY